MYLNICNMKWLQCQGKSLIVLNLFYRKGFHKCLFVYLFNGSVFACDMGPLIYVLFWFYAYFGQKSTQNRKNYSLSLLQIWNVQITKILEKILKQNKNVDTLFSRIFFPEFRKK